MLEQSSDKLADLRTFILNRIRVTTSSFHWNWPKIVAIYLNGKHLRIHRLEYFENAAVAVPNFKIPSQQHMCAHCQCQNNNVQCNGVICVYNKFEQLSWYHAGVDGLVYIINWMIYIHNFHSYNLCRRTSHWIRTVYQSIRNSRYFRLLSTVYDVCIWNCTVIGTVRINPFQKSIFNSFFYHRHGLTRLCANIIDSSILFSPYLLIYSTSAH